MIWKLSRGKSLLPIKKLYLCNAVKLKKMRRIFLILSVGLYICLTSCNTKDGLGENQVPSAFKVQVEQHQSVVSLWWTNSVDPDGDKVRYTIVLRTGDVEKIVKSGITSNFYELSGLYSDSTYSGWVIATDGKGGEVKQSFSFVTSKPVPEKDGTSYENKNFSIPAQLKSYYSSANLTLRGAALKDELARLVIGSHSRFLNYNDRHRYLYDATQDPQDNRYVVLIYDGKRAAKNQVNRAFNTEHIYPQSRLDQEAWRNDIHNFYPCTPSVNSQRGNMPFTDGRGTYKRIGAAWYPGDEWRGDVARIIFYMNLRYNESFEDISTGGLTLLLKWNVEDPVSPLEIQRNNAFEKAQGNRNVFIDNPYLATLIWGGNQAAENRWAN